jgi:hypothetical protein
MTKRTFYGAGRTYVLDSVCLHVYNDVGDLIQMMSLEQARKRFPEFFTEEPTCELSKKMSEIKLNTSHDD